MDDEQPRRRQRGGFRPINTPNGWNYKDSYNYAAALVNNVCSHGCGKYRTLGMFNDYQTDNNWRGTQGGDYGCRDGNNICWMPRPGGCNVGNYRCAYIRDQGEAVIYGAR